MGRGPAGRMATGVSRPRRASSLASAARKSATGCGGRGGRRRRARRRTGRRGLFQDQREELHRPRVEFAETPGGEGGEPRVGRGGVEAHAAEAAVRGKTVVAPGGGENETAGADGWAGPNSPERRRSIVAAGVAGRGRKASGRWTGGRRRAVRCGGDRASGGLRAAAARGPGAIALRVGGPCEQRRCEASGGRRRGRGRVDGSVAFTL